MQPRIETLLEREGAVDYWNKKHGTRLKNGKELILHVYRTSKRNKRSEGNYDIAYIK